MQQVFHEFADPPDCMVRKLGEGSIRLMAGGSVNANPSFLVRLYGSGELRWVDMLDLKMAGNPGDPRDGAFYPPLPDGWASSSTPERPPMRAWVEAPLMRAFAPGSVRTKDGAMISFARWACDAAGNAITLVSIYGRPDPQNDGDWRAATPYEIAQINAIDAEKK